MSKLIDQTEAEPKQSGIVERSVIFRCGFCGLPIKENGDLLPDMDSGEKIANYLEQHKDDEALLTYGACCPNGDEDTQERYVTRDMAIDAGDLSLEGQRYR